MKSHPNGQNIQTLLTSIKKLIIFAVLEDLSHFYPFFNISRPPYTQGSSYYQVHSLYKGHLPIADNLVWSRGVLNSEVPMSLHYLASIKSVMCYSRAMDALSGYRVYAVLVHGCTLKLQSLNYQDSFEIVISKFML